VTVSHFGLINLGRDQRPGSTDRIDERIVEECLELVGDEQAAIYGCEVNEGDDNNELAVFRKVLKGWTMYAGPPEHRVREPIFLSPDQPAARWGVLWVPNTAVQHWSPQRSVLKVHLTDQRHSLLSCHNAAGPHTVGDRPDRYEEALAVSWEASNSARVKSKRRLHRLRRHVSEMSDLNHYDLPGLPGEKTVLHERTDYGFAYPARGYEARFHEGQSGVVHVDSHRVRTMHGIYVKERG
jgi:hypothetical protein